MHEVDVKALRNEQRHLGTLNAKIDEVTSADLDGETVLIEADADSINQVALEIAVLRVPMSVARTGSAFPARMKNGTPDHRQLSISSRSAA